MNTRAEALFVKRLSLLLTAGIGLSQALLTLSEEQSSVHNKKAVMAIAEDVTAGRLFSQSIKRYPRLFSPLSRELIAIGEVSGTLESNLEQLSRELTKRDLLMSKLTGAFIYPLLLCALTLVLTVGLVVFVFPKVLPLFSGLGEALPLPTRITLFLYAFCSAWGIWFLIVSVVIGILTRIYIRRHARAQITIAKFVLRIPIVGTMLRTYHLASVSRSLGMLLTSGMSLPDSLLATSRATSYPLYRAALSDAVPRISNGEAVRLTLLRYSDLFPRVVVDILSAGEAGGGLAPAAFHLAEYYEHEFDEMVRRLHVLVEPTLMILMGLVVGFVALSMILPIYRITEHLNAH